MLAFVIFIILIIVFLLFLNAKKNYDEKRKFQMRNDKNE